MTAERLKMDLIESKQNLMTLKTEIANRIKLDVEIVKAIKKNDLNDTEKALYTMLKNTFKTLKNQGIEINI